MTSSLTCGKRRHRRQSQRVQQPGESVDALIQGMLKLADDCSHLTLKDKLIEDRIAVGVRDEDCSKTRQNLDLSESMRVRYQTEDLVDG